MTWKYYDAGIGNTASYQVSGHPWVTGSTLTQNTTVEISFPFVTKAFTVINKGANDLRVHFLNNANAKADHYVTVKNTGSLPQGYRFEVKCDKMYITEPNLAAGSYEVFAELTRIDDARMFALTGSGIDE